MDSEKSKECNVRVICRFRPLNEIEKRINSDFVPKFPKDNCVSIKDKFYWFDRVFEPSTGQEELYDEAARPIVNEVLAGFNGTIFAYGQTSSGKTYTMEGQLDNERDQGIMPRITRDIFEHIYTINAHREFQVRCSYLEIYLDKIRDLLDLTKTDLVVYEDRNRSPFVRDATERYVASPDEIMNIIVEGKRNRQKAMTNMNKHSSRSHCILLINIKQIQTENNRTLISKLCLVDLAGSEKISKAGCEGMILTEAKHLNRSLSALGNVISSLAEGNRSHIPYRDSKLTRILQESLGGNARTTIIICCSPASYNELETRSTLEFGKRAKIIKNQVILNEEVTADEWRRRFQRERDRLQRIKLYVSRVERELTRWRSGESVAVEAQFGLKELDISINSLCESMDIDSTSGSRSELISDVEYQDLQKILSACIRDNEKLQYEISRLEQKNETSQLRISIEATEAELFETRAKLARSESSCKSLKQNVTDLEQSKRNLEAQLNKLASNSIQSHLNSLRSEISEQEKIINLLRSELEAHQELAVKLGFENSELRSESEQNRIKYQELSEFSKKRSQAKTELAELQSKVQTELDKLLNLRKSFASELANRSRYEESDEGIEHDLGVTTPMILATTSPTEQEQLAKDNHELRTELPRLERRLRSTNARVRTLEHALAEARALVVKDRQRYEKEMKRINQTVSKNSKSQKVILIENNFSYELDLSEIDKKISMPKKVKKKLAPIASLPVSFLIHLLD